MIDDFEKEAQRITNIMIKIGSDNKNFLEVFYELIDKKYLDYKIDILAIIPTKLAEKGYVIENSNVLKIIKY